MKKFVYALFVGAILLTTHQMHGMEPQGALASVRSALEGCIAQGAQGLKDIMALMKEQGAVKGAVESITVKCQKCGAAWACWVRSFSGNVVLDPSMTATIQEIVVFLVEIAKECKISLTSEQVSNIERLAQKIALECKTELNALLKTTTYAICKRQRTKLAKIIAEALASMPDLLAALMGEVMTATEEADNNPSVTDFGYEIAAH